METWERKRNEIRYAQALNCAVQLATAVIQNPLRKEVLGDQKVKEIITTWRDWFYDELSKDFPEGSSERDEQEGRADDFTNSEIDSHIHGHDDLPGTYQR